MPVVDFAALPPTARLWIFAAERDLNDTERDRLLEQVDGFLETWEAHGAPLMAARDFRYDRFLFVGVDEEAAGVSGCSIDALVRTMKGLEHEMGVALVDNSPVLYREDGEIRRATRQRFAELVEVGAVTLETTVFNNTLTKIGELVEGRWEVAAGESWHAQAFALAASRQPPAPSR
jgi:hypothetical protein